MIDHVALETRRADAAACVAFWELLGWHEVLPPDALLDIATWVARGDQTVHFLWIDEPIVEPIGHTAVVVPDFAEAIARLEATGHEVTPHDNYWGSPRAYAVDPGGHRLELMQFGPGVRPAGVNR
jgi:catechol 2,3-dioxygenase-like lactoylglutathione lyase family enzyme